MNLKKISLNRYFAIRVLIKYLNNRNIIDDNYLKGGIHETT